MATLTYRLNNANATGTAFQRMTEVDQAAATSSTGWTVAKTATTLSSPMVNGTEQLATTFTAEAGNPKPGTPDGALGNAFRTEDVYDGIFANANWTITVVWRSVTVAHSGTLRVRARVFRDGTSNGSTATELTGSTQVGGTSAVGSTTVDVSSAITWSPGGIVVVKNEYLIFTIAMEIVTASGNNSADALLRSGSAATTGTRVLTSDFSPGPPRNAGVNFQNPGVFAKAWRKKAGRIFVPDLWLPNDRQPLPVL